MRTTRSVQISSKPFLRTPALTSVCAVVAAITSAVLFVAATPQGSYVAHEWGTFTSVQGGDGTLLAWRPLESSRLPGFVYNWNQAGLGRLHSSALTFTKRSMLSLQRMETPVIYFYPEKEQVVHVSVDFPQGLITEWFPQAQQIGPSILPAPKVAAALDTAAHKLGAKPEFSFASWMQHSVTKESRASWDRVRMIPAPEHPELTNALRGDSSGSHYFTARATDAAFVEVDSLVATNPAPELEKFIFYRGTGNFATPLRVTANGDGSLSMTNTSNEPLRHLFPLVIRNHAGGFLYLDRLLPGETKTIRLDSTRDLVPMEQLSKTIAPRMARSLEEEGLYRREALAMVKTWQDSWFEEDGTRVLYVLPRSWTDQTLPLKLDPAPRELTRVMVGRAEILMPSQVQQLAQSLSGASGGQSAGRDAALAQLKTFGRFAEPALRLATENKSPEISEIGWKVFAAASRPENQSAF
jgi:hypothetical protein